MSKKKNVNVQYFGAMTFLYVECIDELNPTNPKLIQLKKDILEFADLFSQEIADTIAIQKTTYFTELQNKILTVVRKHFEDV